MAKLEEEGSVRDRQRIQVYTFRPEDGLDWREDTEVLEDNVIVDVYVVHARGKTYSFDRAMWKPFQIAPGRMLSMRRRDMLDENGNVRITHREPEELTTMRVRSRKRSMCEIEDGVEAWTIRYKDGNTELFPKKHWRYKCDSQYFHFVWKLPENESEEVS